MQAKEKQSKLQNRKEDEECRGKRRETAHTAKTTCRMMQWMCKEILTTHEKEKIKEIIKMQVGRRL